MFSIRVYLTSARPIISSNWTEGPSSMMVSMICLHMASSRRENICFFSSLEMPPGRSSAGDTLCGTAFYVVGARGDAYGC